MTEGGRRQRSLAPVQLESARFNQLELGRNFLMQFLTHVPLSCWQASRYCARCLSLLYYAWEQFGALVGRVPSHAKMKTDDFRNAS